jgi:uncharacterized protein YegJ (DUF2314 family)
MFIEKIIINTPFVEMARKTHLKIRFDNQELFLKINFDLDNKYLYVVLNNEINNIENIELGEFKYFEKKYFINNFGILKYEVEKNLIYINVN